MKYMLMKVKKKKKKMTLEKLFEDRRDKEIDKEGYSF